MLNIAFIRETHNQKSHFHSVNISRWSIHSQKSKKKTFHFTKLTATIAIINNSKKQLLLHQIQKYHNKHYHINFYDLVTIYIVHTDLLSK